MPRNSVFYSSMALIKMLILFDEIGKRVTIEKNGGRDRIIWYISRKYFSYAFARALKYHKFMIGLWRHPIQNADIVKPGAFLQSESLIKESWYRFPVK